MKCRHYEDHIILMLYNELPEKDINKVREHLKSCAGCREFLEENKAMFSDISDAIPDEFDPAWNEYWSDIIRNIRRKEKRSWPFFPVPSKAMAFAMSALILIGGIFIGRFFAPPDNHMESPLKKGVKLLYVNHYFEDVKPVMLDLANYTIPAANGNGGPVDREIISGMLYKTRLLKRHVSAERNPYLSTLLEELELILTEISNTTPGEKDTLRTLQGMIREKNIPLKIDLYKNKTKRFDRI